MTQRSEFPRESVPSFPDVDATHWAHDEIMKAANTYPVPTATAVAP